MSSEIERNIDWGLTPKKHAGGYIEIPIEKLVDGEVVTIDTKAVPIIQKEQ